MDCWYPITVPRHTNYRGKDNLLYTYVYGRMQVPCGRCPACRRRKQNEWAYRILEEAKYCRCTAFVTLTYDDDHLPISSLGVPTLDPGHLHKFFKNLRYNFDFRYFACGEYGDKFERPHYHFILFTNSDLSIDQIKKHIEDRWTYGFIEFQSPVTPGRAKYCAKYSMKQIGFDYQDAVPPFARMSRRPGLGKKFLDMVDIDKLRRLNQWHVHDQAGTPYNLPRYYKERMYSKDEIDAHSMLLEKLKNSKLDSDIMHYNNNNTGDYFKYVSEITASRERQFIKVLKKENYGYKFNGWKRAAKERQRNISEDFVTDEF